MDTTKSRKRKKRRNRLPSVARCGLSLAAVVLLAGAVFLEAAPKKKDREEAAIVAGTVFQSSGRSVPGAKVEAVAQGDPKVNRSALSDSQGDFAIRVPAGRGTYVVTASAKGFQTAQKTVEVYETEKVRANLILSPEPKK
jgi:Carboxypeptidase regulatory-like domain